MSVNPEVHLTPPRPRATVPPTPTSRQTFMQQQVQTAPGFQSSTAARLRHSSLPPPATPQGRGYATTPRGAEPGYHSYGYPSVGSNNPSYEAHGESGAFSRAHGESGAQTQEPTGEYDYEHTFAVLRMTRTGGYTKPINQKAALMSLRMVCSDIGIDLPQKVKMME